MISSVTKVVSGAMALLLAAFVAGCVPTGNSTDEEKDPHFLEGKSRVGSMDYNGAIESYERALQVNPHSSAAHFELGWLYDQKEHDPAAAIYHYSQYLKYHPSGPKADLARGCIAACKQELAKSVSLAPVEQDMEKEFDRTQEENKRLKEELEKWRAYYRANGNATAPQIPGPNPQNGKTGGVGGTSNSKTQIPNSTDGRGAHDDSAISVPPAKTYTVKSGDTPAAIARKYRVRVDALMAANPRVDARRLRPGQSLVIPVQ
jgi:LysM repeat protein